MGKKLEILPNQEYNKFIAIKFIRRDKKGQQIWLFKCECGKLKEIVANKVTGGYTKSCGCLNHRNGNTSPLWNGYEEINGDIFSRIKNGAIRRNISFTLTIEDLWLLYLKQDKKCALSGVNLFFPKNGRINRSSGNLSLDRIDSTKGYIIDNIQWVSKEVNWMKQDYSQEEYIRVCKLVAEKNKNVT